MNFFLKKRIKKIKRRIKMFLKVNLKLFEKGMRIVNGLIIMIREERMKIVYEIKEWILDKYGDDVKVIGVYGFFGC